MSIKIIIIIVIIESIVLVNLIKEVSIYLNKMTLIPCKENAFKKFIYKKEKEKIN